MNLKQFSVRAQYLKHQIQSHEQFDSLLCKISFHFTNSVLFFSLHFGNSQIVKHLQVRCKKELRMPHSVFQYAQAHSSQAFLSLWAISNNRNGNMVHKFVQ